jgi:replicative DNA helicase
VEWDANRVHTEWGKRGHAKRYNPSAVFDCVQRACLPTQIEQYVSDLASANAKLRLSGIADGMKYRVEETQTPEEIGKWVVSEVQHVMDTLVGPPVPSNTTTAEVMAWERPVDSWIIENLIASEERVILTATEGLGKSTVLSQIAVAAAAGLHPFTGHVGSAGPQRALHVDLENPRDLAMERWQAVLRTAQIRRYPLDWQAVEFQSYTRGIDVASPRDRTLLRRWIEGHQPRVLCIGPLYRMTRSGSLMDEEASREVQSFLDDLRSDYSLSIVTEAHSPNEQQGHARSWRPIGSSVWRRWPEFGFGLVKDKERSDATRRFIAQVHRWRYDRVRRNWPSWLERAPYADQMWWDDASPTVEMR